MRGNPRNTGARTSYRRAESGEARPTSICHFRTGNSVFSTPVIGPDETIYVGSADTCFYALDPIEKRERWRFKTGEAIDCAACIHPDGTVFVPSCDGSLYALDKDGAQKWRLDLLKNRERFTLSTIYWWEANVVLGPNGLLYAGNDDFYVYAIEPETGAVRWALPTGLNVWTAAAFDGEGTAFVISFDMHLYAVDQDTGAIRWTANTGNLCASSPVLSTDGILYFGSFDGHLHAVSASTGAPLWKLRTGGPVYATPALAEDGTLYVGSSDGLLYAIDTQTRCAKWTFYTGDPIRSSAAVGPDPEGREPYLVYVGGGNGLVYALDPTGKRRWSYDTLTRAQSADYPNINASIALGNYGLATASANGDIVYIPYDHYLGSDHTGVDLRPDDGYPAEGAFLFPLNAGGAPAAAPAARFGETAASVAHHPTGTLSLRLVVRQGGQTIAARMKVGSVLVDIAPPWKHRITLQADGTQLNIIPEEPGTPGTDYLVRVIAKRDALGGDGATNGSVEGTMRVIMADKPAAPELRSLVEMPFRISHMSIHAPSIVPSFDQIGIASLHIDVRVIHTDPASGRFIAVGVQKFGVNERGELVGVPVARFLRFAFAGRYDRGHMIMEAHDCSFELTSAPVRLDLLRFAGTLDEQGAPNAGAALLAEATHSLPRLSWLPALSTASLAASATELGFAGVRGLLPDADVLRRSFAYARTWLPDDGAIKSWPDVGRALARLLPFAKAVLRDRMHRPWDLLDDEGQFCGVGTFRATRIEQRPLPPTAHVVRFELLEAERRIVADLAIPAEPGARTLVPSIILVDLETATPVAIHYDRQTTLTRLEDGRAATVALDVPPSVPLRGGRIKALLMLDLHVVRELRLGA